MLRPIVALVLLLLTPLSLAEGLRILTVDEPPSSFVNEQGEPAGFAVDVVHAIQEKLGDETSIEFMPEIRVLKTASENPNVLLFGFSKTPEREQNYHMVTLLLRKPWVLYSLATSGIELADLEAAKTAGVIGVVRGDVRAIYLEQMGFENIQKVAYHELNVKLLLKKRIDMLFYEPLGMAYATEHLGLELDLFKPVLTPKASEVYLMMSKAGTDPELVERWQEAANELKEEGVFEQIAKKWSGIIQQQTGVNSYPAKDALTF